MRNWRGGDNRDLIRQPFGLTPSPCVGKASPSVTGAGAGDTSPGGGGKAGGRKGRPYGKLKTEN